jgi:predicted PurR-regulated permease PerM
MTETPLGRSKPGAVAMDVDDADYPDWAWRRDVTITVFLWAVFAVATLWLASLIVRPILIVIMAAMLAFAVYPAVRFVRRILPLPLAILVVYLILVGIVGVVGYLFVINVTAELTSLGNQITYLLTAPSAGAPTPLVQQLEQFGLSQQQIQDLSERAAGQLQSAAENALPLLAGVVTGLFGAVLDAVLVLVLSLYFLVAGPHMLAWLGKSTPRRQRRRVGRILTAVQSVVGGYLRGQFTLSSLIGVLVGGGMFIIGVPYAVLLGLLAFLLEFIPTLGTLLSGVVCVLVALTLGWQHAVIVLGYFVLMHLLEGYVVAPRVLARAVGLHPVVSIIALLIGAELFGVWGALFAAPVAGLLQVLASTLWKEWRQEHSELFPEAPTSVDPALLGPTAPPPPTDSEVLADLLHEGDERSSLDYEMRVQRMDEEVGVADNGDVIENSESAPETTPDAVTLEEDAATKQNR